MSIKDSEEHQKSLLGALFHKKPFPTAHPIKNELLMNPNANKNYNQFVYSILRLDDA